MSTVNELREVVKAGRLIGRISVTLLNPDTLTEEDVPSFDTPDAHNWGARITFKLLVDGLLGIVFADLDNALDFIAEEVWDSMTFSAQLSLYNQVRKCFNLQYLNKRPGVWFYRRSSVEDTRSPVQREYTGRGSGFVQLGELTDGSILIMDKIHPYHPTYILTRDGTFKSLYEWDQFLKEE